MFIRTLVNAWRLLELSQIRGAPFHCPSCGPSVLLRISASELGVRCIRCGASAVTLSVINVLRQKFPNLHDKEVYELSTRGPLVRFIKKQGALLTTSEFLAGFPSGQIMNGIRCEDVQHLSFADESFDLCTSTEVFEHVPDDIQGFREVRRILKQGGLMVFTVPLNESPQTRERARLVRGKIEYLMEPEYHGDHLSGIERVLCFRDYGADIQHRLLSAGFASAQVIPPEMSAWWGYQRWVIVATK